MKPRKTGWDDEARARFLHEAMERWHSRPRPTNPAPSDREIAEGLLGAIVVVYIALIVAGVVAALYICC